jgi:hypothetical protein
MQEQLALFAKPQLELFGVLEQRRKPPRGRPEVREPTIMDWLAENRKVKTPSRT